MRSIRTVGLCLVAVFVLSAAAVASATPASPEIGRCVKVAPKTGHFTTDECKKEAKETKLGEWEFEPGAIKNKFTGAGGEATLETVHAVKVICNAEASAGEFTSDSTVGNIEVTFTGCTSNGFSCSTAGSGAGEVVTNALAGDLVWEKFGKDAAIDLFPASTELFVEFNCGPANAKVKGSVMAKLPVNKMETKVEQKFSAKKGKQKPEYYYNAADEKIKDVLISKIGGTEFEQAGQTVTNVQTDEEALEVNTVK
jgi:hypothetical protein